MPRQQTKTVCVDQVVNNTNDFDQSSDSYLESILRWDNSGCYFDLHFPFGKITLDRDNKIVDKNYLCNSLIS